MGLVGVASEARVLAAAESGWLGWVTESAKTGLPVLGSSAWLAAADMVID